MSDATENVENMCNIIDNEQVKEHNLEKSWEFEQSISDWLKRIHQHREDLTITTDTTDFKSLSQVAETQNI
ncbi:uncharacterized protein OCT59_028073 [Rhizophagus irregularis]|uniref:Uncharacterized protein n=2 Tax=Rhizophagus irregularis TaxID=588596 RepID=A0A015LJ84_RHIIW|nr:hypothetical protein RirG_066600 [Rhizophagus irregularis DAOM 197198w]UZO07798.1 hypothetical protein OCT59_028073 [Rhizophagus irregularis]CAG8757263.1 19033_t:CDS:2 [Rhizophagus irregularis]